jgi:hypothetical protein
MFIITARIVLKEGEITQRCSQRYLVDPKGDFNTWSTDMSQAHQFNSVWEAEDHLDFVSRDVASGMAEPCQIPLPWQYVKHLPELTPRPYKEGDQLNLRVMTADGEAFYAGHTASF